VLVEKGSLLSRIATSRLPSHIPDLTALEGDHRDDLWFTVVSARFRTALVVPLLNDNEIVGIINLGRKQMQPFTDKQISLFSDFAAQATIALESTRRERSTSPALARLSWRTTPHQDCRTIADGSPEQGATIRAGPSRI
jgi:GAF domain-containing protein